MTKEHQAKSLAEVVADVAAALGLESYPAGLAKKDGDFFIWLNEDGSNLTAAHWIWECLKWLVDQGLVVCLEPREGRAHLAYRPMIGGSFEVACPLAEAPARLVSAVWRRMQQAKP